MARWSVWWRWPISLRDTGGKSGIDGDRWSEWSAPVRSSDCRQHCCTYRPIRAAVVVAAGCARCTLRQGIRLYGGRSTDGEIRNSRPNWRWGSWIRRRPDCLRCSWRDGRRTGHENSNNVCRNRPSPWKTDYGRYVVVVVVVGLRMVRCRRSEWPVRRRCCTWQKNRHRRRATEVEDTVRGSPVGRSNSRCTATNWPDRKERRAFWRRPSLNRTSRTGGKAQLGRPPSLGHRCRILQVSDAPSTGDSWWTAMAIRRHWFHWQLPTPEVTATWSWTSRPNRRVDWVIYHRRRLRHCSGRYCCCRPGSFPFVLFWISFACFGTRFWFDVRSSWAAWPFRCVAAGIGSGWSGTPFPIRPVGRWCRPSGPF